MPMYYFDIAGTGGDRRDEAGRECAGLSEARQHAMETACGAVVEHCGEDDWFTYTVRVRDLTGALVCAATLTETRDQSRATALLGEIAA